MYPATELFGAFMVTFVSWYFGFSLHGYIVCLASLLLYALAVIDLKCMATGRAYGKPGRAGGAGYIRDQHAGSSVESGGSRMRADPPGCQISDSRRGSASRTSSSRRQPVSFSDTTTRWPRWASPFLQALSRRQSINLTESKRCPLTVAVRGNFRSRAVRQADQSLSELYPLCGLLITARITITISEITGIKDKAAAGQPAPH